MPVTKPNTRGASRGTPVKVKGSTAPTPAPKSIQRMVVGREPWKRRGRGR